MIYDLLHRKTVSAPERRQKLAALLKREQWATANGKASAGSNPMTVTLAASPRTRPPVSTSMGDAHPASKATTSM